MPRYYCDYCDTYLTHDSPSVRKQHNAGYKHKANVRAYYQQFEEQQTQSLIDQKVKEHLGQTAAVYQHAHMGGAFHQHLSALGQFKPPMPLPVPGSTPGVAGSTTLPSIRPPVLPPPTATPASVGYGSTPGAPQFRVPLPPPRPPGITTPPGQPTGSSVIQQNGLPRPPVGPPGTSSTPPGAPGVPSNGPSMSYNSSTAQPSNGYRPQNYNAPPGTASTYPQQPGPPPASSQQRGLSQGSGSQGNYAYGPPSQPSYSASSTGPSSVPYRT